MAVKPIPDGYDRMIPYLSCEDAARAIDWYKQAFGAEEICRLPGPGGKIMHAELKINGHYFFLADAICSQAKTVKAVGGCPVSAMMYVEDVDKFFERAEKAGARVEMPLENMFWGDRFGSLIDPEGFIWSMASHIEDVTPEEMEKRMAAMPMS